MRVVVTTLVTLMFWLWAAPMAAATDTTLVNADPAKNAQLSVPPGAVVLTFNADIDPGYATVVVNSADGHNWAVPAVRVDGPRVTADIGPERLAAGPYTVEYRVSSLDRHGVSGQYDFTVVGAAQPKSPSVAADSSGPAIPKQVLYAGIAGLAVGGVIAFWQSRKRRGSNADDRGDERD